MVTKSQISSLLSSLNYPQPYEIEPLKVAAEYHSIWVIQYSPFILQSLLSARSIAYKYINPTSLVLRVANVAIPSLKTINEVAVLR